jgi:uncharacterized protein YjbI with pentapeptide repeats
MVVCYCIVNHDRATGCSMGSATLVDADLRRATHRNVANLTYLRLYDRLVASYLHGLLLVENPRGATALYIRMLLRWVA